MGSLALLLFLPEPKIYVGDRGNGLYQMDDMEGKNQVLYDGSAGTSFSDLRDAYVDGAGSIFVATRIPALIYKFQDMSGTGQQEYAGTAGTAFGQAYGVFADPAGGSRQ